MVNGIVDDEKCYDWFEPEEPQGSYRTSTMAICLPYWYRTNTMTMTKLKMLMIHQKPTSITYYKGMIEPTMTLMVVTVIQIPLMLWNPSGL
jgi:hypothetical protein